MRCVLRAKIRISEGRSKRRLDYAEREYLRRQPKIRISGGNVELIRTLPSGGLRRSRSRKSRAQKQTTGSVLPEHDVRGTVVEAENEERRETRLLRFARCVSAKVPLIHSIDAPNVGVLSAERPRYRRMPASDRPPHGAELSCRQRSATPDGRHGTSSGCFGERSLLRESFRRKSIPSAPRVPVHAGTRRSFPETPVAGSNNFRAKSLHRPKKRITFAHRFAKFRLCGRNGGCSSVG